MLSHRALPLYSWRKPRAMTKSIVLGIPLTPMNINQESTNGQCAENSNIPRAAQLQMICLQQNFYT